MFEYDRVTVCGQIRTFMIVYGQIWTFMVSYDPVCGRIWFYMVVQYMVKCGQI
jgi:hypothetical protein